MTSIGLVASWGVGTLASPTTFYPCGCKHPSPHSLCVLRREREGLWETTPSLRRLLHGPGSLPDHHQDQGQEVTQYRHTAYAALRSVPSGMTPVSRKRHRAMSNLRATATIPIRRRRLPTQALSKPATQRALRLIPEPTPGQLRGHPAHVSIARLGDALFSGTLAAVIRCWR